MKYILLLAILVGGYACTTLSDEELQWRHQIDADNWYLCQIMATDVLTSTHDHRRGSKHRAWEVRDDLRENRCKSSMGKYWIEY